MGVTKGEQVLWQQKYLQCCEELNQWEPIQEYARATDHSGLLMDCLWRTQDWHTLKQEVLPKAHVSIPAPTSHLPSPSISVQPLVKEWSWRGHVTYSPRSSHLPQYVYAACRTGQSKRECHRSYARSLLTRSDAHV